MGLIEIRQVNIKWYRSLVVAGLIVADDVTAVGVLNDAGAAAAFAAAMEFFKKVGSARCPH